MTHTFVLHDVDQGHKVVASSLWPWAKEQLQLGRKLVLKADELEDDKSDRQRRYYHGVVLAEIAEQARANGQKFPLKVWKEHFRETYLGSRWETRTDPMTGNKKRRKVRISTEDLGVKKYSELIEKVTAFAVTELGVRFSVSRWQDYQ
ncbi:recombination protein NinB [Variovorax sp. JS1663]|uniref:recombination protein NinB n=1 Tax=Variovorax sp. JS1663 TaxID=1851577 RepID=UPI000B343DCA|nr:recombination protein NinB [Variovorax sp. JS1663]OUM00565.1 hypothetical protein A8M77_21090 [Variovorax sp. JS1663]